MILFMVMMWLVVVMMMTFLTMMMVIIIVIVDNDDAVDDHVDDGVGGNANWVILGRSRRPARRLVRAAGIRIMRFKS